ncbi:putative phage tail protein [Clostridium butyricum]|uniref:putative phage tail protein n=1 Tax=Clostridium butyricum TaxID=1492 RepID=UPI00325BE9C9
MASITDYVNITLTDKDIEDNFVDFYKENYIPESFNNDPILSQIFKTQGKELAKINYYIKDLTNQFFVETATWGIRIWEEDLGITVVESDDLEDRRARCLAKIRSTGTCTEAKIKEVAKSFKYGDIEIEKDYAHYKYTIKFVSDMGIPPKMEDFKASIELISPAHLGIEYQFKYFTWGELHGDLDNTTPYKFGELKIFTWGDVLEGNIYHNTNYYNKSQLVTNDGFSIVTNDGFGIKLVEIEEDVNRLTDENGCLLMDEENNSLIFEE